MIKFYSINPRLYIVFLLSALLIEIAGFIFVGKEIGTLATLSLVILTTTAGIVLLRIQGSSILKNLQREFIQGHSSKNYMLDDVLIVLGTILLILPGFVSDIFGILLFIRPTRFVIIRFLSSFRNKTSFYTKNSNSAQNKSEDIIDLNAEDYKIHNSAEHLQRKNDDTD